MGRKGSRYSLEDKLYYIHLVEQGQTISGIERQYGVKYDQVKQWIERYQAAGIDGLKRRKVRQYSAEFKQEVVNLYLAGGTSYPQLAKQFDIPNNSIIYQWVNLYTSGKSFKTTRRARTMKTGRKTTQKERIEIVQWTIANDYAYHEAASHFEVSYQQVYTWVKKLNNGGVDALADRRGKSKATPLTELDIAKLKIKELEARTKHLEMEKDLSKKLKEIQRRVK